MTGKRAGISCPKCGVTGNHRLHDVPCDHRWHVINGFFHGRADLSKCEPIRVPRHDAYWFVKSLNDRVSGHKRPSWVRRALRAIKRRFTAGLKRKLII